MTKKEISGQFQQLGVSWAAGEIDIEEIDFGAGHSYKLNEKQKEFLNSKSRYVLYSGGYGAGKTLPLLAKMILYCLCFPKNRVLLGRKTLSVIELQILPDLFELVPSTWYKHRVKDGVVRWFNGSEIVLFGLDAMQSGSQNDIKKAQQKMRSLNLGAYFIDQLEEIEYEVFQHLNARLRRKACPIRQGNMTTNPANYWAYNFFKRKENKVDNDWVKAEDTSNRGLIETSMLDNEENLPEDYIEDQMKGSERYVKRYVYGEWSRDILTDNVVFAEEYIKKLELSAKKPIKKEEGCRIFKEYDPSAGYQMGVDPSEGSIDPSSISVVSNKGEKVAKYNGYLNIPGLIEKVKFLSRKYHRPKIIPEANASGTALIQGIKDLRLYQRKVYNRRDEKETVKLGFHTNYQTKQALISHFQELLRKNYPKIYDKNTIEELKTFIWSDSAKQKGAGADSGSHDDDVMSTLLAFWELSPERQEKKRAKRSIPRKKKKKFQYI